jgi:putative phosphonate metabolism protein
MAAAARVAIYYAPSSDDALATAGATWLGRDAQHNIGLAQPPLPDIAALTQDPRRYGFHATLKPPMRLAPGRTWFAFVAAVRAAASTIAPFSLPPLHVADLHGFLALRETAFCAPLQSLCDKCVVELDDFRAPPDDAELQRRRKSHLTAGQDAMLQRWGYPYVLETWFFHMTLTRRLDDTENARVKLQAEAFFADAISAPRQVSDICLFTQATPDSDFVIAERLPLRG